MKTDEIGSPSDYRGNKPRSTRELLDWHAQANTRTAIDTSMPIVDAHHHVFGSTGDTHFYRLEDLQSDLDSGHRIVGTVYVEAYRSGWRTTGPDALRPVGETETIVGLTGAPLPTRMGDCHVAAAVVCHADLSLGDRVEEVLREHLNAAQGRLRGVRHRAATVEGTVGRYAPEARRPRLLSEPEFRRGIARLAAMKLSFDTWIYHTQLGELIELADACPDTAIVLNHVGGPLGVAEFRTQRAAVLRDWEKGMRELAARPNISIKVGGMGMALFGFGFEHREKPPSADELARAWAPSIETCVDAFGTRRCMFESNFPVDKQSCSYHELWNAFKLVTRAWSPNERADLFHRTACKVYGLPALENLAHEWVNRGSSGTQDRS